MSPLLSAQDRFQWLYHLWLAVATLLVLSLLTSLNLLVLDTLFPSSEEQPSGLILIVAIMLAMLITYPLLMALTQDFFHSIFLPQLTTDGRWILFCLVAGFIVALLVHWLSSTLPDASNDINTFDLVLTGGKTAQILLFLVVVLLAPIFEEYLFRGLILDPLDMRFGKLMAICLSAVVFMGFHLLEYYDYWLGLMAVFLLGLLLGWIRIHSRSLLNPMLCHASYNLTILLLV